MNFIVYLIVSVGELLGVMVGVSSERREMLPVGLAVLAIFTLTWLSIVYLFSRSKMKKHIALILSIAVTTGVVILFCCISIVVEAIWF